MVLEQVDLQAVGERGLLDLRDLDIAQRWELQGFQSGGGTRSGLLCGERAEQEKKDLETASLLTSVDGRREVRFCGVKYCFATRCTSSAVTLSMSSMDVNNFLQSP